MANTFKRCVRWLDQGLESWYLPPICQHCRARRFQRLPLCRSCLKVLLKNPAPEKIPIGGWEESHIHSLFHLTPPLKSLIHGFKYRGFAHTIEFLGSALRRKPEMLAAFHAVDLVIPVPLHPTRRRERGYNQAELIARQLVKFSEHPIKTGALVRIKSTPSQTRLNESERTRNLNTAFSARSELVSGCRVLMVDDVFTTGSTLNACRRELVRAGAARVDAFTLAYVERRDARGGG